jgi:hypothetical protein
MFNFILVLDICLSILMICFNLWVWYLACSGSSSVEYWYKCFGDLEQSEGEMKFDFSFVDIADNLFEIFGTNKLIRVLSPSLRNVPFTGIEWAFLMQDLGFDQTG